jgi:hypothetical protein
MSDWYYKNRDRILLEKREKYANDKQYREKKKEQTLDNYYSKKKECMSLLSNMKLKLKR